MLKRTLPAALLAGLAWAAPAHAEVSVEFAPPQSYADAGNSHYDSVRNLARLGRYLEREAARCLKPGERLELRMLELDLAGRQEWWHGPAYGVRVMRDITWPRMEIAYRWRDAGGQVVAAGQERLADMAYLWRSPYLRSASAELPYEKAMLRDWVARRFCTAGAG